MPLSSNIVAAAALFGLMIATPAISQVTPYRPYGQPGVTVGDVHRYEMDRLRSQADRNQALATSQALQTRLTIQQLQAQRQPPLSTPSVAPYVAPPPSLDAARRDREETEARSQALTHSTSQIDNWLDRRPQ